MASDQLTPYDGELEGILELVPTARVGFVGLYRDEETKQPITYYERFPPQIRGGTCIVIDPMLATGGSTVFRSAGR